ncbi:MAG: ABC transporter substrate-binding protein [Candidatus Bipolaricaulis sp.]|nr:ABC transporter substrate-binding protein [Candidatus Bipolaricaulis sp.]
MRKVGWKLSGAAVLAVCCGVLLGAVAAAETLTIAHNLDPETLNPLMTTAAASESVALAVVEKLVIFDTETSAPIPWLLESWEYVDATCVKLSIRKGISFSNGEPLDAEAVKFSLLAWMEQPVMAQATQPFKDVEFEILDANTIVLRFQQVVPTLLSLLARYSYVVPPKYYAEVGPEGFGVHPIGTGPFVFVSHAPDYQVVFDKNPNYWRGARPIDRVIFLVMPEDFARAAAVESGEADIAYYISDSMAARLQGVSDVAVYPLPGMRKFGAFFNAEMAGGEPLLDARVRVALNHAVDIEAILGSVFNGNGEVLRGQFAFPGELGYNSELPEYAYDPDLARSLIAQAGYPNGFTVTFAYPTGRYPKDKEVGEILASYFEAVGVKTVQRPLEWGQFNSERKAQTLGHIFFFGLLLIPDLQETFNYMAYGKQARGAPMMTWPQEWWDLFSSTWTEPNPEKRAEVYHEMLQMDYESPYAVYLYRTADFYAARTSVKGFLPRADQMLFLYDVYLED